MGVKTDNNGAFEVGEIVQVKTLIDIKYTSKDQDDSSYIMNTGVRFLMESMSPFCGKHVKIVDKRKLRDGTYRYNIEGSQWNWTDDMFVPKENEDKYLLKLIRLLKEEENEIERDIQNWKQYIVSDEARKERVQKDIETYLTRLEAIQNKKENE